jgi:hypothetical protein
MNDNAGGSRFRWPLMMAYWRFFRRGRCSIVRAFSCPGKCRGLSEVESSAIVTIVCQVVLVDSLGQAPPDAAARGAVGRVRAQHPSGA